MGKVYSYNRISSSKQSIDRQIRNAKKLYPDCIVIEEVFTGTKIYNRPKWNDLIKKVQRGDTIVFDSVSRMSRSASEGFLAYKELFDIGVELVFIKEPHINTDTYKKALTSELELTGTMLDSILEGINKYLLALAEQQIKLAFEQSEKEVKDLQQRTREGIETARLAGKQIGLKQGSKLVTKKSVECKGMILKYSRAFKGTLNDKDVMKLLDISRNTYYKYKKELVEELNNK